MKRHTVTGAIAVAVVSTMLFAGPAQAGRWVSGGTFDPQLGVAVNFLRYLAGEGEGQMTIRCDELNGLWVDAGSVGGGVLPEGLQTGDLADVTIAFIQAGGTFEATLVGELLVRSDGAVLASVYGPEAAPLAAPLLETAERIDITIGETTSPVTTEGLAEAVANLSSRCEAWPE